MRCPTKRCGGPGYYCGSPVPDVAPACAYRLAAAVVAAVNPVAVLLFGSWVRGAANLHSDVDLIVVLADRPVAGQRAAVADAVAGGAMKVDVLVWSLADLRAARSDPHSFGGSVLPEAVVLAGALPPGVTGA